MNEAVRIASVTGVDLAMKVAGPGARSYAFVIDWHIRVLLALAWLALGMVVGTGRLSWVPSAHAQYPMLVVAVVVPAIAIYVLYHPVLEVLMRGRTPGKRMAGVRIVMADGRVPGILPLLVRNVLRLLDSLPAAYVVGLIATMVTRNAVRIGDLAAGTLLVYDQADARATAATLIRDRDAIARHGLERAELARELLERWPELAPEARTNLARRVLERLGDPAPAHTADDELVRRLRGHVTG